MLYELMRGLLLGTVCNCTIVGLLLKARVVELLLLLPEGVVLGAKLRAELSKAAVLLKATMVLRSCCDDLTVVDC